MIISIKLHQRNDVKLIKMYAFKISQSTITYQCVSNSQNIRIRTKLGEQPRKQKLILGTGKRKGNSQEFNFIKFCCIRNLKKPPQLETKKNI